MTKQETMQRIAELEFEIEEALETGNAQRVQELEFEIEELWT